MEFTFVIIIAFISTIVFILFQHRKDHVENPSQTKSPLYFSLNKNSYSESRDVFKVLDDANIRPQFIGETNEQ